jgi:hypothetical protein
VLKFLGLPLGQIGRLLKREAPLGDTLRRQQQVLAEKRRRLDMAIRAIGEAERSVHSRREPDWELFKTIVREIEMQNTAEWSKKYYSAEAQGRSSRAKCSGTPSCKRR